MEKFNADKKAKEQQVKKEAAAPAPKPAAPVAQPKPVQVAAPAAPVVVKQKAQPAADITKSESFKSKVQDIQNTLHKKHTVAKISGKKSGFSLMNALGGKKKAQKVEAQAAAAPVVVTSVPIAGKDNSHLALNRDFIKAKEQKEKEIVKEEDMAYSTDAISDYGANLNTIHDKYQNKFSADKKDDKSSINDIEVSSLDDEETPAQKKPVEVAKAVV